MSQASSRSLRALDWLNFFLADIQTGVGPFVVATLAARKWNPEQIGAAITVGGLVGIFLQTPAGAAVDAVRKKRALIAAAIGLIVAGSMILAFGRSLPVVLSAQVLLGLVGPFVGPAVTAISLGLVGKKLFDTRVGRNHGFDSAGNVCAAVLLGWVGFHFGNRAIFLTVPLLAIPALVALFAIPASEIDYLRARGARTDGEAGNVAGLAALFSDRVLLAFGAASFLFHFANAAMLPQLGELLARGHSRLAAPFMSAAITVTQTVIAFTAVWAGKAAGRIGRKPLLLFGFGVLPIRGVLYTLTNAVPLLIAIQILDGLANSIFVVTSTLVIADRTSGTGRLNVALGGLATTVGIGAGLSNLVAGAIAQRADFARSFLVLAAIALVAFLTLCIFVPETLEESRAERTSYKADVDSPVLGNARGFS